MFKLQFDRFWQFFKILISDRKVVKMQRFNRTHFNLTNFLPKNFKILISEFARILQKKIVKLQRLDLLQLQKL